jgi:hypothetical protein
VLLYKYQYIKNNGLIGRTSLPAELRNRVSFGLDLVGDGRGCGHAVTRSDESRTTATPSTNQELRLRLRRIKNYGYAFDFALRLRHRRSAAMGSWARWHSSYTNPTWAPPGGTQCAGPPGALPPGGPGVPRRHGISWSLPDGYSVADRRVRGKLPSRGTGPTLLSCCQAGTVCLTAGSPNVRRLAVNRRHGSAGRLPDGHSALGCWERDDSPGRGQTACLDPLGTTRQAQCACSLGARRLAGRRPSSASRRQFQLSAPHTGLSAIWRAPLCPGTLWPEGRVSRQGQPGRRSGQGQRASLRSGPPVGPGIDYPVASGRCGVLTRRGQVNRDAQWQDWDRFSRSVEPAGR